MVVYRNGVGCCCNAVRKAGILQGLSQMGLKCSIEGWECIGTVQDGVKVQ
mgnify:CR=1 FL=1